MKLKFIAAIVLLSLSTAKSFAAEISITMDDFDVYEETKLNAQQRNDAILAVLKKHKIKATLFVVGKYIQSNRDRELLKQWSDQGHMIGNHTFDHKPYNAKMSLEDEKAQVLKCEAVLKDNPGFEKIFRFPMLAEGDTPEKRDQFRGWLKAHGYRLGEVTIDASDWYIDQRMRSKLAADPNADLKPYRDYYLEHIWDRAQYYNNLSKKVLGREVKHTLLVHYKLLNALYLDDLLTMFETKGWKLIDAKEAFKDPVFAKQPKSMPSGQSLLWALAKESGKYDAELRYPGEDDVYEKPKMDALGL
ncbi:polysaccharide deacetylase [Bdellovibrio sp. NC01]|nr:polysaccharide deacetylase [Bdellovibrio sp. NC01]